MNQKKRRARRPQWAIETSNVLIAMTQSRLALRRAARRVEDRRLSQRMMRLARRKRASAADLRRVADPAQPQDGAPDNVTLFPSEIATATEIGAVAACLRANRRLRSAIGRALDAHPPERVRIRLEDMRPDIDREAANLNGRLNELVVQPVVVDPTHDVASTPGADVETDAGHAGENVTSIR